MNEYGASRDIVSSLQMRLLETNAEYYGISLLQLMENAGRCVAEEVSRRFSAGCKVAVFCGLGGNGGDGFVAARHLVARGYSVQVIVAGQAKEISHPAARCNWEALQFYSEDLLITETSDASVQPPTVDVVIDALLGTGTRGKLKPPISQFVELINKTAAYKVAVDVPTGINADTGEVLGNAVKADLTITFYKLKPGLHDAKEYTGEVLVKDIGLPHAIEQLTGPGDVITAVKARPVTAHKGDFGRLLVVGGSEVFSGAPTLVALAALRTGADIVYLAAPAKTAYAVSSISPDLITLKLQGEHLNCENITALSSYVETVDAVVLGPGLGLHPETMSFVEDFLNVVERAQKPLLLDADGLKAFARFKKPLKTRAVFTPHSGEYAVLTGQRLPEDLQKRAKEIQKTAAMLNVTLLVKGHVDIISDGKNLKFNFTGNPGMTVGGTGDVLSGIAGALLAQGNTPFAAAAAAAFANGASGDFAVEKLGYHIVASDLIEWIPQVLNNPMNHARLRKKNV
jgi:NAD(P)H-hydrate epimerase